MAGQRRWARLRQIDLAFVLGAVVLVAEVVGQDPADRSVVIASLLLMGVPLAHRVDDQIRNGSGS